MPRIKIKDLPKETKVSKEEMKKVLGGALRTSNIVSDAITNRMGIEPSPFKVWADPALA